MVRRLSQSTRLSSAKQGKALIASLAGSMVRLARLRVASLAKIVPILGALVSAFRHAVLSAAPPTPSQTSCSILNRAHSLDFNPPDYREFFKAQKEKWDIGPRGPLPSPHLRADTATGAPATSP